MNASLPPDDERREEREDQARQEVPAQTAPGIGLGSMLGLLAVVGLVAIFLLPMFQHRRGPARRSTHTELEQRQQAIEQAAREARDEDRLADNR